MLQHRFRIDREANLNPAQQRWRARSCNGGGCSEFPIIVDFEALAVELDNLRLGFELRGTNLSREVTTNSETENVSADGPFRESPAGSWTVLEVFMPGEEEASFDLGLNPTYGQGMLVVRRHLNGGLPLTEIFGPLMPKSGWRRQEMELVARSPNRMTIS